MKVCQDFLSFLGGHLGVDSVRSDADVGEVFQREMVLGINESNIHVITEICWTLRELSDLVLWEAGVRK